MMISGITATNRFRAITMARCLPSILLNRRTDSSGNAIHGRFSSLSWYCRAVAAHVENLPAPPPLGLLTVPSLGSGHDQVDAVRDEPESDDQAPRDDDL